MADTLKVRATQPGHYDLVFYSTGDVFTLREMTIESQNWSADGKRLGPPVESVLTAEAQFSEVWMEIVPEDTPLHTTTAQEALNRDIEEIKLNK